MGLIFGPRVLFLSPCLGPEFRPDIGEQILHIQTTHMADALSSVLVYLRPELYRRLLIQPTGQSKVVNTKTEKGMIEECMRRLQIKASSVG